MKKGVKIALIVLASILGVGVLAGGGFVAYKTMGSSQTINLNDYMQVEYTGKDGKGKASMDYDTDAMKEDYPRVDVDGLLHKCVDGEFDSAKNLSNGDKITWEWECDDNKASSEYRVTLEYEDETFKVKGLKDSDKDKDRDKDKDKDIDIDKYKDKDKDKDKPKSNSNTAKSLSEIDEDVLDAIEDRGFDILDDHYENDFSAFELVLSTEYIGTGFASGKSGAAYDNIVQPVYKVTVCDDYNRNGLFDDSDDPVVTYYTYIDFYNVPCEDEYGDKVDGLEWHMTGSIYRPNDSFYYWGTETLEELIEYMMYYYSDDYVLGENNLEDISSI